MDTSYQATAPRPGVVTFIGAVLYIQAFLAAVAAVSMVVWRDDIVGYLERHGTELADGTFTGSIIGEAIMAVLLFVVAAGIMRGSSGMRLFVAIVQSLAMGVAVYGLIAHHVGGYVYRSVFTLFVGVFVLWALYANEESDRFFATNG